jgi:hypothetical protein
VGLAGRTWHPCRTIPHRMTQWGDTPTPDRSQTRHLTSADDCRSDWRIRVRLARSTEDNVPAKVTRSFDGSRGGGTSRLVVSKQRRVPKPRSAPCVQLDRHARRVLAAGMQAIIAGFNARQRGQTRHGEYQPN